MDMNQKRRLAHFIREGIPQQREVIVRFVEIRVPLREWWAVPTLQESAPRRNTAPPGATGRDRKVRLKNEAEGKSGRVSV